MNALAELIDRIPQLPRRPSQDTDRPSALRRHNERHGANVVQTAGFQSEVAKALLASLRQISGLEGVLEDALYARLPTKAGGQITVRGIWQIDETVETEALEQSIQRAIVNALELASRRESVRVSVESMSRDFVQRAAQLEILGYSDTALDLVYDAVDELIGDGRLALCDSVLAAVDVSACSTDLLLGLLTATYPAKAGLATRSDFFARVESDLMRRPDWHPDLLLNLR